LQICQSDEGYLPYSDGNYRRVTIEDNKEKTFKEESNNEEVQVTEPHQVVDNIVSNAACYLIMQNIIFLKLALNLMWMRHLKGII